MTAKDEAASAASSTAPKVSMFAAKCGFVIPKNKLSGSLVPVFRGNKSLGASDADSGESNKQIQRKTKWGPDLTQDASVRKGRALAYQARVDQITQQLKYGMLEAANDEDLPSAPEDPHDKSSRCQIDREEVEQLELEKREAIGEILKLNPSYKAPPDYKPLLKESTVPIPVKEYPRYNFLGLIYGPGSDNQRQLEKETGAKIQVYGTKAGTGEKVEVKPWSEMQGEYEQLYVHVSADTFEKVDAAVAVIELLVTSVPGNLAAVPKISASVSGDNTHAPSQGQDATTHNMVPTTVVNQGIVQPVAGPTQPPLDGQFQCPSPFFSRGPSSTPVNISGFTPLNSSRPFFNNPTHLLTSPFQSTNLTSLVGTLPALVSPRQHSPTQVFQQTYMAHTSPGNVGPPRNLSLMAPQPSSVQFDTSASLAYMGNRAPPIGSSSIIGPFAPSFPQLSSAPTSLAQPLQSRVTSSVSESVPNFTPLKPPMMVSPNPGDFTFQPHRPQNPSFQAATQPSSHFSAHNAFPARTMAPPPAPQAPSFQFPVQNMTQTGMLSRPQVEHMGQPPPAHISTFPFARYSTAMPVPPRLSTFLDTSPLASRPQYLPMGTWNLNPAHQMPHLSSHLPPRHGNHIHYPAHSIHPEIPRDPDSQFSNNLAFASGKSAPSPGGRQLYDPFSHASMSSGTQQ